MGENRLSLIQKETHALRQALKNHGLYLCLQTTEDVKIFMESHVFAVWDFMSLLKALQRHLTCVELPWKPVQNPKIARFVNEIVWGEESDINELGEPASHFEMYLAAMEELGADTMRIETLMAQCTNVDMIYEKLLYIDLTRAQREFLQFTFKVIATNEPHKIAAAFTFGREDIIPEMFLGILKDDENNKNTSYPKFKYYLERHIEVDGDSHGPLALEMIGALCNGEDKKWNEVLKVAVSALSYRCLLWDEIMYDIELTKG